MSNSSGPHALMVEYPTSLPADAVVVFIDKLRGKDVETGLAVKAGWNLIGYGLGTAFPVQVNDQQARSLDDAAAADFLEQHLLGARAANAAAVPWDIILPILFDVIRRWLSQS